MNRTELLARAHEETGHHVTPPLLYYIIAAGYISKPPRNEMNRAVYGAKHLAQLLKYIKSRRGVAKKAGGKAEVVGPKQDG
jgi:hypothetical protein